jgi:hypothetical protein
MFTTSIGLEEWQGISKVSDKNGAKGEIYITGRLW